MAIVTLKKKTGADTGFQIKSEGVTISAYTGRLFVVFKRKQLELAGIDVSKNHGEYLAVHYSMVVFR